MKLIKMEILPIELTIVQPGFGDWGNWKYPSVFVRLHTDEGITGVGEAAVQPFYLGDTTEGIIRMMAYIWDEIRGQDPTNVVALNRQSDMMTKNVSIKAPNCAVDTVLYDILGKSRGEPVYKTLLSDSPGLTPVVTGGSLASP